MKFVAVLIVLVGGLYWGVDHWLGQRFSASSPSSPEQQALVQNMAKFLETSPDLQQKIADSGQTVPTKTASAPSVEDADLEKLSRYFGNTSADQYFKKYLLENRRMNPEDPDDQTKLLVDLSRFIHENPKDAVEALEGALQSLPTDLEREREAIKPAFIHAAIQFIDESGADDQSKLGYLKRFIDHTQDPEIKDALESHYPDLMSSEN